MTPGAPWLYSDPPAALLRPRYKLVIECFFDDSGSEGQADHRFVCMAGYLGHDKHWGGFLEAWQHLLFKHAIPAIHMKDWEGVRLRKHWAKNYAQRILAEFIKVISDHQLIGLGVAVDANVWRSLDQGRRKAFGDAQEFCFQRVLRRVVDRMESAKIREPIGLVFDRDFQFARPRLKLLEHLYKRDPRLARQVVHITFADSEWSPPLQAADLLAWETRRSLVNRTKGYETTANWRELFSALPPFSEQYEGEFWDAEEVELQFPKVEAEWKRLQAEAKARAS